MDMLPEEFSIEEFVADLLKSSEYALFQQDFPSKNRQTAYFIALLKLMAYEFDCASDFEKKLYKLYPGVKACFESIHA